MRLGPFSDGHWLVVAGQADVEGLLQQPCLGAEGTEHRLAGDTGGRCDVVHRRCRIAVLEEQCVGRVADAAPGLAGLVGPERGPVGARRLVLLLDRLGHFVILSVQSTYL